MAFELQIAARRDVEHRLEGTAQTYRPSAKIELLGELDERAGTLLADQIDAEIAAHTKAILVSLGRVSRTQLGALCALVAKIQRARKRGFDVRIVRPKPALRMLLRSVALCDAWTVDEDVTVPCRSVIIAWKPGDKELLGLVEDRRHREAQKRDHDERDVHALHL